MAQSLVRSVSAVLLAGAVTLGTYVPLSAVAASNRSTTSTTSAVPATWKAQASGTQQPLFAVSCIDAARCKAVGARGTVRYTKNGGATWRAQNNPLAGSSTTLYRIACIAPSTCYVIGRPFAAQLSRTFHDL